MFAVLNPRGRDREQSFPDGAGRPNAGEHPPVNYHAYAACRKAGFFGRSERIPDPLGDVLILLRKNNLRAVLKEIRAVRGRGGRAWISLKESGQHQIAEFFNDVTRLELFLRIAAEADGFLASTPQAVAVYRNAGMTRGGFAPTPYPVEASEWNFGVPLEERNGIFVGTREFDVASRRHAETILAADRLSRKLEVPVAVVNLDGRTGGMKLKRIRRDNPLFFIIEGPVDYPRYVKLMASHRVVFQLDRSAVPGQVAGDALLCRMPCVGGDGTIDELVFGADADLEADPAVARVEELLTNDENWNETMRAAVERASKMVSFEAGRRALETLFGSESAPMDLGRV